MPPDPKATLKDLTKAQHAIVVQDIGVACHLAASARNSLLLKWQRDPQQAKCLSYAFGIAPSALDDAQATDKVAPILDVYSAIPVRIYKMRFFYDVSPMVPGEADNNAFVPDPVELTPADPRYAKARDAIWLRKSYFDPNSLDQLGRATTLIHELVHVIRPQPLFAHPGPLGETKIATLDEAAAIGIDYSHAINNPYCYEYYALWNWVGLD